MPKLDLVKTLKHLYTAKAAPAIITVPEAPYLSVKGKGDPDGNHFYACVQALYAAAYSVKFINKQQQRDFTVSKLEGLWWVPDNYPVHDFTDALKVPRDEWQWQLLIRMPAFVTAQQAQEGLAIAAEKKPLPALKNISLISLNEGKCVQVLHAGPYSTEPVTLRILEAFIEEKGLERNGLHHEIYLSDPRKTAPEKMRTILRQPVK